MPELNEEDIVAREKKQKYRSKHKERVIREIDFLPERHQRRIAELVTKFQKTVRRKSDQFQVYIGRLEDFLVTLIMNDLEPDFDKLSDLIDVDLTKVRLKELLNKFDISTPNTDYELQRIMNESIEAGIKADQNYS